MAEQTNRQRILVLLAKSYLDKNLNAIVETALQSTGDEQFRGVESLGNFFKHVGRILQHAPQDSEEEETLEKLFSHAGVTSHMPKTEIARMWQYVCGKSYTALEQTTLDTAKDLVGFYNKNRKQSDAKIVLQEYVPIEKRPLEEWAGCVVGDLQISNSAIAVANRIISAHYAVPEEKRPKMEQGSVVSAAIYIAATVAQNYRTYREVADCGLAVEKTIQNAVDVLCNELGIQKYTPAGHSHPMFSWSVTKDLFREPATVQTAGQQ